ncbi:MAG: hypothetical protein R2844_16105 [Caldilineales bacterium]
MDERQTSTETLLEIACSLTPCNSRSSERCRPRPGMPLEIAVRVSSSEEINQPLADLRDKGVVAGSEFSGGTFGNELISLTVTGEKLPAACAMRRFAAGRAHETRGQSADLLRQRRLQQKGEMGTQRRPKRRPTTTSRPANHPATECCTLNILTEVQLRKVGLLSHQSFDRGAIRMDSTW